MPKLFRILLASAMILLSVAAIFFFSEQSGTASHRSSQKVAEWTADGLIQMHPSSGYTLSDFKTISKVLEYPIRKLAHLCIYFILGLMVYLGLRFVLAEKMRPRYALFVVLLVFLVACADEINQYYSGGRGASFSDVILDTCGGALGMYFFHIVKDFISHIKALFRK